MKAYLSGKIGVIEQPSASVVRSSIGMRLGNCPDKCPPGYTYDHVRNVCVLAPAPVGAVVLAGKNFGKTW